MGKRYLDYRYNSTKGIPKKIKIGDIISVEDVSITVRHIIVNYFIEDIPD